MSRSVIAGLYDKHVFEFLRNYFPYKFYHFTFYQQCMRDVCSQHSNHLVCSLFFIQLFSDDVISNMISICISLVTHNIEHHFMCHSYIFCDKMSVHVYCSFSVDLFFTFELWEFFIYSRYQFFIRYMVCKYSFPDCTSLYLLRRVFCREKAFNFDDSSVPDWRIPGTGEPDGLLSMGSHRVGHDWSDLAAAAASIDLFFLFCV